MPCWSVDRLHQLLIWHRTNLRALTCRISNLSTSSFTKSLSEISYTSDGSQHRVLCFHVGQQAGDVLVLVLVLFDQRVFPTSMRNYEPGSPNCEDHAERDTQPVGQDWSPGTQPKHLHLCMCREQKEWSLSLCRHSSGLPDFADLVVGLGKWATRRWEFWEALWAERTVVPVVSLTYFLQIHSALQLSHKSRKQWENCL